MPHSDPRLDSDTCFLSISPGGGHEEVQAWAAMLHNLYRRVAERRGYELDVVSLEETKAGIAGVTLELHGPDCANLLAGENGVHSLVRVSPFDSNQRRHTSFASVECVPALLDVASAAIDAGELHTTSEGPCGVPNPLGDGPSAPVRVTHTPTHITVRCSGGKTKELTLRATRVVSAKVHWVATQEEREAKRDKDAMEVKWGSSTREFVLDPFQRVKDLRSQKETTDTAAVLDGDLSVFLDD